MYFRKVSPKSIPPKKVSTITSVFLKNKCAKEKRVAFTKTRRYVELKKTPYRLKKKVR